ncbi:MAG: DUF3552 domain-containing protein, partial [Flavisolibacter sp.]|nr:DUF3552 domain-containing protein [Flavisolibacter sp.]
MDLSILSVVIAVVALLAGIVAGKFIFAKDTKKKIEEAETHAQNIIKEGEQHAQTIIREAELRAETIRKEKELAAKERFVKLKAEHEKEVLERNRKIVENETRL